MWGAAGLKVSEAALLLMLDDVTEMKAGRDVILYIMQLK